ncbi:MAG: iron chelate uptake ABC transporter family permease subunit, partial [Rudaea sp.]
MTTQEARNRLTGSLRENAAALLRVNLRRPALAISFMLAVLLLVLLLAIRFGTIGIGWEQILGIVLKRALGITSGMQWTGTEETIIWELRLPRVIGAALVGGALAGAGVIFQGLLRNPLADPYLLGTSGGAALLA